MWARVSRARAQQQSEDALDAARKSRARARRARERLELVWPRHRFQTLAQSAFGRRAVLDSPGSRTHQARSAGEPARAARRAGSRREFGSRGLVAGPRARRTRAAFALRRCGPCLQPREFLVLIKKKELKPSTDSAEQL